MDAADEDLRVLGARMAAPVAERRVLALRTDFERAPGSGQLVAAVSAQAEHATSIGRLNAGTEPALVACTAKRTAQAMKGAS
jgi:hypothetical protein